MSQQEAREPINAEAMVFMDAGSELVWDGTRKYMKWTNTCRTVVKDTPRGMLGELLGLQGLQSLEYLPVLKKGASTLQIDGGCIYTFHSHSCSPRSYSLRILRILSAFPRFPGQRLNQFQFVMQISSEIILCLHLCWNSCRLQEEHQNTSLHGKDMCRAQQSKVS